jgi:AcrR family transcriptional regulator
VILRESARLFCARGYDVTSLEDIAEVVGTHKATLYHYVKSKEDILYLCLLRSFSDIDEVEAGMKDRTRSPVERLRFFFRTLVRAQATDFGRCNALVGFDRLGPEAGERVRSFQRRLNHAVIEVIQEGVDNGSIRPCDPWLAAALMFGAFNWVPHWWDKSRGRKVEDVGEQFLELLIGGIAA